MRYFTYVQPIDEVGTPGYVTVSEDEIRTTYYPDWLQKMNAKYGETFVQQTYSFEECLADWMVIHWAWQTG